MGYGSSQVKMNLEKMKTAMEACEAAVTSVEAVTKDVKTTMTNLEDDYIGEDADTLQRENADFAPSCSALLRAALHTPSNRYLSPS